MDFAGLAGKDLSQRRPFKQGCPQMWTIYQEPATTNPTIAISGGTFRNGERMQITVTPTGGSGQYDIFAGAKVGADSYYVNSAGEFQARNQPVPARRNVTGGGIPITVIDLVIQPGWGSFPLDLFAQASSPGTRGALATATSTVQINSTAP